MATIEVHDWNEFITAVGTVDADVVFPHSSEYIVKTRDVNVDPNKLYVDSTGIVQTNVQPSDLINLYENTFTLDANDYAPVGLTSTIEINCKTINGYGGYIKNLASYDADIFTNHYSGEDNLVISQLAILSFNVENHHFFNTRYCEWEYSIFSGRCKNNSTSSSTTLQVFGDGSQTINNQFTSCSFTLILDGRVDPFVYYYIPYDYFGSILIDCRLEIHKTDNENSTGGNLVVAGRNSYFTGDITSTNDNTFTVKFTNTSIYSIIEIETSQAYWDYSGNISVILINSDTVTTPQGYTIPSRYTQVNTATLGDANALSALGFPIQI